MNAIDFIAAVAAADVTDEVIEAAQKYVADEAKLARVVLKNPCYLPDAGTRIIGLFGSDLGCRGPWRYIDLHAYREFRGPLIQLEKPRPVRIRERTIAMIIEEVQA